MSKKPIFGETFDDLVAFARSKNQGSKPLRRMIVSLVKGSDFFEKDSEMSLNFLSALKNTYYLNNLNLYKKHVSLDGTLKYLFTLEDGKKIESVALKFNKRYTLCLSSQAGCAMNCTFCATGKVGLLRSLKAHEIVQQYLWLWRDLNSNGGHPQTPNIVFMGQGEPMHNFDELKKAIEILCSTPGIALGPKQITISTVGYLPGLKRFQELPEVNLAISLHTPFDDQRNRLIPVNRAYSLEDLFEVLDSFEWHHRKRINFEYLLLGDVNDSDDHALSLANLISRFPSLVNIIPFNPFPGSGFKKPSLNRIEEFKNILVSRKVKVMIRQTKGDDVLAACGQLANSL